MQSGIVFIRFLHVASNDCSFMTDSTMSHDHNDIYRPSPNDFLFVRNIFYGNIYYSSSIKVSKMLWTRSLMSNSPYKILPLKYALDFAMLCFALVISETWCYQVCSKSNALVTELLTHQCHRQTLNISHTLVGNKLADHSDEVGASPVGAALTTSSFSAKHMASFDWEKTSARRDKNI